MLALMHAHAPKTAQKAAGDMMKVSEVERVLILGAGTMGRQIGFLCAMHGYRVMLYDISRGILDKALNSIADLGKRFALMGS